MISRIPLDKIKQEKNELQNAVRERTFGYILTALGLVAGLAWNDAIKTFIEELFPFSKTGIIAKFVYALIITGVVALAAYYISKFFIKKDSTGK